MSDALESKPGEPGAGGETAQTHKSSVTGPNLEIERRCLSRLIDGEDAWQEFFYLFHGFFVAVARRRGNLTPEELEDLWCSFLEELLVNDCQMLRRHLADFPGHSFKSILWHHVKQLAARFEKRRRAETFFDDVFFEAICASPGHPGLGNPALAYEQRRMLRDAVVHAVCKARDRRRIGKILSLRFISAASNKEIAGTFGMSENLVADIVRRYGPLVREYLGQAGAPWSI